MTEGKNCVDATFLIVIMSVQLHVQFFPVNMVTV